MTNIKIGTTLGQFVVEVKSEFVSGEQPTTCPVCYETHKSSSGAKDKCGSMNLGKGTFHCNRCGIGGVVVTDRGYVDNDNRVKPMEVKFAKSDITPTYIKWLAEERSISLATAEEMNLHVIDKAIQWKKIPENFPNRELYLDNYYLTPCLAAFYIYHDQLINIQYRDMWKNFAFEAGGDLVFFNADVIAKNRIVMITEGWMDTVACKEAGLSNVISVPNGITITKEEKNIFDSSGKIEILSEPILKYLDNCWIDFTNVEEVILATDDDAAGQKLMEILRRRFTNAKKKVSKIDFNSLPNDPLKKRKDFNDVLKFYGKKAVVLLYEKRIQFRSPLITRLNDVRDKIINFSEVGMQISRKLGWTGLDPHYGWFPGDIIASLGFPTMGKTTFNQNKMIAMSVKYDTKHLIYSPENMPAENFLSTMVEIYSGKSLNKSNYRSFNRFKDGANLEESADWVHDHFFIANKSRPFTLEELRDLAIQEGCSNIFVDPWNRLSRNTVHRDSNIDRYIQEELTEQIIFGLQTKCSTIIALHPITQTGKDRRYDKKDGGFDHPSAFEAEGGKVWYSSVHVFYTIHRPPIDPENKNTAIQTLFYSQKLKVHKTYGTPTGDLTPLVFEMQRANNRLYLNEQSPLGPFISRDSIENKIQPKLFKEYGKTNTGRDYHDDAPF